MLFNISGGKDVIRSTNSTRGPRDDGSLWFHVGLTGNTISRDQFKQAMTKVKEMAASGQLPSGMNFRGGPGGPGGPGGDMDRRVEERFQRLDKNQDGVLSNDELTEALQGERDKYDTNHNGEIDLNEYRAYVNARMGGDSKSDEGPARAPAIGIGPGGAAPEVEEERKRPTLLRAGNLPRDFPYASLDTDVDGQVGLYEWKQAGRRIAEFLPMDLNNDGYLTVDEYYRWRKQRDEVAMKSGSASGEFVRGGGRGGPGNMMAFNPGMNADDRGPGRFGTPGMPGQNPWGAAAECQVALACRHDAGPGQGNWGGNIPGRGMDMTMRGPGGGGTCRKCRSCRRPVGQQRGRYGRRRRRRVIPGGHFQCLVEWPTQ